VHLLESELSDVLDCLGCSKLELNALHSLVEVECVVTNDLLHLLFDHLN